MELKNVFIDRENGIMYDEDSFKEMIVEVCCDENHFCYEDFCEYLRLYYDQTEVFLLKEEDKKEIKKDYAKNVVDDVKRDLLSEFDFYYTLQVKGSILGE